MQGRVALMVGLACAGMVAVGPASAAQGFALSGTNLLEFSTRRPGVIVATRPIVGISAGESLVGIDFRPQNGLLYALGVNATSNTATLYALSTINGFGAPVGVPGGIAFVDAGGNPIDLPDPATTGYGVDFNPSADRVRVVTSSGLNLRINPSSGTAVDGDNGGPSGSVVGVNPDGPINGATTGASATAYTSNQPNTSITTQYTLDGASNSLFLQNPPNSGTQTMGQAVTVSGSPIDFTDVGGFDIPSGVNALSNNQAVAAGSGFASLTVGGVTQLWQINLVGAVATLLGPIGSGSLPVQGLTVRHELSGVPMIGLGATGTSLLRFSSATPGTTTTVALTGVIGGDSIVGIDFRPQTGQLMGLGVNATLNTASLYLIDPQNGACTTVGPPGSIAFTIDGVTPIDFPDPAVAGYGVDFNPTVDRLRVTTTTGINFRVNPNNGQAVDGNNGSMTAVTGNNPDGAINGGGVFGVAANAYTNSFGRDTSIPGPTTLYALDAAQNLLTIQNPPNAGTQTTPLAVTINGAPLDFTSVSGFDIPAAVTVSANNAVASGAGFALLTIAGTGGLYAVDLTTGNARAFGAVPAPMAGLAIGDFYPALFADGFE